MQFVNVEGYHNESQCVQAWKYYISWRDNSGFELKMPAHVVCSGDCQFNISSYWSGFGGLWSLGFWRCSIYMVPSGSHHTLHNCYLGCVFSLSDLLPKIFLCIIKSMTTQGSIICEGSRALEMSSLSQTVLCGQGELWHQADSWSKLSNPPC